MTRWVKVAVTVVVVAALAMSGIALAQTSDEGDVADTPAYSAILDALSNLVDEGTIDQSQAEAVAEHLASQRGPRDGFRGKGGHFGAGLGGLTELLGVTAEELRTALSEGQSLADIAAANGSSVDEVVGHLLGELEAKLDEAVEQGRLDADEAAEKLAGAEERITEMVNGTFERPSRDRFDGRGFGDRGFDRGGRGGFGGFGGPPPFDGPPQDAADA